MLKLQPGNQCYNMSVHSPCPHNEIRSLEGRVLRATPQPNPMAIRLLQSTAVELAKRLGPSSSIEMDLLPSHFPQHKRKLYSRALQSLRDCPLRPSDWWIKAFVKCEKIRILEKRGDPRMIQARTPRFNLALGAYTRAIEHKLYTMVDEEGRFPLIAKGLNQYARGKLLSEMFSVMRNPVVLSCDLSRFDMHVNQEQLRVAHLFYKTMDPDPFLQELLERQLVNRGRTQNDIKYMSSGGVMSGDMTTALGNCVLLIVILTTIRKLLLTEGGLQHLETMGIKTVGLESGFLFLVDGDDHVVVCEKDQAPILREVLPKWFNAVGHSLKIEGWAEEIHQIEFCQTKPLRLHGEWVMMPDPRKVLATAFMVSKAHFTQVEQYLGTVWQARAQLHSGMPVLGPLFARLSRRNPKRLQLTEASFAAMLQGLEHQTRVTGTKLRNPSVVVANEARVMVAEMWGISLEEQWYLENQEVEIPNPRMAVTLIQHKRSGVEMEELDLGKRVICDEVQSMQSHKERMYMREEPSLQDEGEERQEEWKGAEEERRRRECSWWCRSQSGWHSLFANKRFYQRAVW